MNWMIGTTIGTKGGQGTLTAFEKGEAIFTLADGSLFRMPYLSAPVHVVKHRKGYKAAQSVKADKAVKKIDKADKADKTPTEADLQDELAKVKEKLDAIKAQRAAINI